MYIPPFTSIVAPVTNDERSEARKRKTLAISVLAQCSGLLLRIISFKVQQRHGRAVFGENARGRITNTVFSRCAGNDGEFILE